MERENSIEVQERIKEILSNKWIGYSKANEILEKLEDLLRHPKIHRMPNILITGETNNGKTTIVEQFLKNHPNTNDPYDDTIQVPVVKIEMPPEANQDSIYISILRELFVPFQINAKKEEKASQVIGIMRRLQVRMLIIDEMNNLLDNTVLKQAQVLNTIKYLGNKLQIPIVAVGTKEAHRAILSDSQLSNRFKPYELKRWSLNIEYRKLLKSFEKLIGLKSTSHLDQRDIAIEIMNMSEGWIGEVSEIIKSAAIAAIKNKNEKITVELLRKLDWITPSRRRML